MNLHETLTLLDEKGNAKLMNKWFLQLKCWWYNLRQGPFRLGLKLPFATVQDGKESCEPLDIPECGRQGVGIWQRRQIRGSSEEEGRISSPMLVEFWEFAFSVQNQYLSHDIDTFETGDNSGY